MILKVELFAGTDIKDVCEDLCELATRVGCIEEGNFNGVLLWAKHNGNPQQLIEAYFQELKSERTIKIAKAWT